MTDTIPENIKKGLAQAAELHQRTSADFEKCQEVNRLMSDLLGRLEDAGCYRTADRVMSILLDCNPKQGTKCDNSTRIADKVQKLSPGPKP